MHLISWNVAYHVKKQPKQLQAVSDQTPDLICLQEVTEKTARLWKVGLQKAGYPNIITTFDTTETPDDLKGPRKFGLLIASKRYFEGLNHEDLEIPWPEKLLSVLVHHP